MNEIKGKVSKQQTISGQIGGTKSISTSVKVLDKTLYTDNYNVMTHKPAINGITLEGDKSFEELGEHTLTNSELKDLVDTQYDLIFGGG